MRRRNLEESCKDRMASRGAGGGVQRFEAWFAGAGFERHRHDTYAIGLTDTGVQCFWYRGAVHASTPGEVVVLHPDEVHDGYAATGHGFGYRILYVDPARVAEASRAITGRQCPLPFLDRPVVKNARLRNLIQAAFTADMEPLMPDAIVLALTRALLLQAGERVQGAHRCDARAVDRARQVLDTATRRQVHSTELEAVSGLSRFELARQFRAWSGTSPYRYSVMRRLEWARDQLGKRPIVRVALDAAFADQAHFTRSFKAAFGVTPGRYMELHRAGP